MLTTGVIDYLPGTTKAALITLGRFQEALACHKRALEIDPRYTDASYNKGRTLHALSRYQEAIVCYAKALETYPQCVAVWFNKGVSLAAMGQYEEALACYEKALELIPDAFAWNNKGNGLYAIGRYEESAACYEKALEIDPRFATASREGQCAQQYVGKFRGQNGLANQELGRRFDSR